MKHLVVLSYLAWFPLVIMLFHQGPKYRALIVSMIFGSLFLPELKFEGTYLGDPPELVKLGPLVALTKAYVLALAPLLAAVLLDYGRVFAFRPKWFDVPMIVWCLSTLVSDYLIGEPINNLYGQSRDHVLIWGVPYFLGRLYLDDFPKIRETLETLIVGTLAYIPLCLVEIVRGPYWHEKMFGYFQHDPGQSERMGGFRPIVFMQHGLELSLWIVLAAMAAFWLWRTGALKSLAWKTGRDPIAMEWVATGLVMMAVLTKSLGALMLGVGGMVALYQTRWLKRPVLVYCFFLVPLVYISVRTEGSWSGKDLVLYVAGHDPRAAQSAEFRFDNEVRLIRHAMKNPWFGHGDTGQALAIPKINPWDPKPVPDGLWILTLGGHGLVGLIALYVSMLLPSLRFLWSYPVKLWTQPLYAGAAVLIVFLPLYMIDCLFNAMINPVYILFAGALQTVIGSVALKQPTVAPVAARARTMVRSLVTGPAAEPEAAVDEEVSQEPMEPAIEAAAEPASMPEEVESPAAAPPGVLARRLPSRK